jgi:sodium-coupled neutral amino acid transporter 9
MMGTSLLVMPWALQQAGFAWGIFLMMAMALIAFYTAYRIVESPHNLSKILFTFSIDDSLHSLYFPLIAALGVDSANAEFSDVCRYFWGKNGEYVSVFFSIVVLLGGIIVYFVLMSNFLFYTGNIVHGTLFLFLIFNRYYIVKAV